MVRLSRLALFFSVSIITIPCALSQDDEGKFVDFFTLHPNYRKAASDSALYPSKLILAPIISFAPETSLGFGVGSKYLFKFRGSGQDTRTSNMPVSVQYTLKNQFIIGSGFEIFSPGERWMLKGRARFQNFPRLFYGVGRATSEGAEEEYQFRQVLLEPILLKRLFIPYLFIGGGIRFNRISRVELEFEDGLLANADIPGRLGNTSLGTEFALVYDSRNNLLNAESGWFLEFTYGWYDELWGSSHNFRLARLDLRHYINLSAKKYRVLGFQVKTHYSTDDTPLAEMAFLGGDEIMRGFYDGRFINSHMIAFQSEYRFHLFDRFGAVVFAGFGDVATDVSDFRLQNFRPSAGIGLRFMLDRREKLNLRLDSGFGKGTNNYYLKISEAF